MKAMLIHAYGPPEAFQYGEIDTPKINDDEILVRVKGSSVNPVDCAIRSGLLKSFVRLKLPAVLGVDASGEVVEAGRNVTKFKVGDNVYAFIGENLQKLTEWIEQGKVKPVIEKTYSWKQLADAHRHCETGRMAGKIAITVNPDARVS